MKQSTIKDVRTTLIVLLVSILSSASAIYILPTVIAPVHAGFSNPAVTINPSPVPVGTAFSVQVNVPAGQNVTYICIYYNILHSGCCLGCKSLTRFWSATDPRVYQY